MLADEPRIVSSALQISWVDFAAGLGDEVDTPFFRYLGKGFGAHVRGHGGEDDGGWKTWVAAKYGFRCVVAVEFAAKGGKGGVVEVRVRVGGLVNETPSEGFDRETGREREAGVKRGELGGPPGSG